MEEINQMHESNIEWGCIVNLANKIGDMEDNIDGGWMELVDMIADAIDEEHCKKTRGEELFFNLYNFLWRLYYRLKTNPKKRRFNIVSKVTVEDEDVYRIQNYDYQLYKWVRANNFDKTISNDYIDIRSDSLSDKQQRYFERRCNK